MGSRRLRTGLLTLAFVVGGGAVGYGYYRLVGCSTGACPLTSNPTISTLYGAVLGFLFRTSFRT